MKSNVQYIEGICILCKNSGAGLTTSVRWDSIYFPVRLSIDAHNEMYWLMFELSALCFAIHYWLMVFEFYEIVAKGNGSSGRK